jgi:uncharacterized BrkB/YihY/UPF0761 family membrane protein
VPAQVIGSTDALLTVGYGRFMLIGLITRGNDWVARQSPATVSGVAVGWWKRYRAVDGPAQSALLALYVLVAVIPALLVVEIYLEHNPTAFANSLIRHYGLNSETGALIRSVLVQERAHELGSALFAIAGALFFGLAFGRVLQLVHIRAWSLSLEQTQADQGRHGLVLLGLYGLLVVFLLQLKSLAGGARWDGLAVTPGWIALLIVYFLWAGRTLTHQLVSARDLLPGALATGIGIVLLMILSRWLMEPWVNLYARDYGGFGVVMAIFFWIAFSSFVIVGAAVLAPVLAERRALKRPANGD